MSVNSIISCDTNGGNFDLTWISQPIAIVDYTKLIKAISHSGLTYSPMEPPTDIPISQHQWYAIRAAYVRNKIVKTHSNMLFEIPTLAKLFKNGKDILELANKSYSPLALMRNILIYSGYPRDQVQSAIKSVESRANYLTERESQQLAIAIEHDYENPSRQSHITEVAQSREDHFVAKFISFGIPCTTQNELIAQQTAEFGHAVITPDVLFHKPIMINGKSVRWIEFKDYVGVPLPLIQKSVTKQCDRYYTKWGHGAICFSASFVEGFEVPHTLVLDGSGLLADWSRKSQKSRKSP